MPPSPHRVAVQSSDKPGKATVDQSLKTATSISTSALQAHKNRATLTRLLSSASSLQIYPYFVGDQLFGAVVLHCYQHPVSPRSFVATQLFCELNNRAPVLWHRYGEQQVTTWAASSLEDQAGLRPATRAHWTRSDSKPARLRMPWTP